LGWLKFDISEVPNEAVGATATLRLYCDAPPRIEPEFVDKYAPVVAAYHCSSDSWAEESITWSNQPSYSPSILDTQRVYYNDVYHRQPDDWWFSWDVSAVTQTLNINDDLVTIVVKISSNSEYLPFYSKENGWSHPQLVMQWTDIPEFPSFLVLPIFMTAALLAVIICKRKYIENGRG